MGKLFNRQFLLEELSDIDNHKHHHHDEPDDDNYGGLSDNDEDNEHDDDHCCDDDDDDEDFDDEDEDELNDYISDADEMTIKFERRPEEISVMAVPTATGDENYVDYDDIEKLADYEECSIATALSNVCALYEGMSFSNTRVVLAEKSSIAKSLKGKDKKEKKKMKKKLDKLKDAGIKIATDKKSKAKGNKVPEDESCKNEQFLYESFVLEKLSSKIKSGIQSIKNIFSGDMTLSKSKSVKHGFGILLNACKTIDDVNYLKKIEYPKALKEINDDIKTDKKNEYLLELKKWFTTTYKSDLEKKYKELR